MNDVEKSHEHHELHVLVERYNRIASLLYIKK